MFQCLSPTNPKKNKSSLSPTINSKIDTSPLSPNIKAKTHITEGLTFMRQGNYNEALNSFSQATLADKEYAASYTHQALALEGSGKEEDKEKILGLYRTAIFLNPDDLMARYGVSCITEAKGDIDSANELKKEIASHKAKTVSDYKAKALCSYNTDKFLSLLKDANKINNNDPSIHFMAAQYYFTKQDYKNSFKFIQKALETDKNYVDALVLKGDIWYKKDEYKLSLDLYDAALKINPLDLNALMHTADTLYKMQEYQQSLEISNHIITIYPNNHLAYSYIAASLFCMKNFSEALNAINQSIELATNEVLYFCIRAKIFTSLNNRNYAVKDLNEAYRLHNEPNYQKDDDEEKFVQNAFEERKKLIESLSNLSSPSLDTMYGAEEKRNEAQKLHAEREALEKEAFEQLETSQETSIIKSKLDAQTARVLKLEQEISHLRKDKNSVMLEQIEKNPALSNYLEGFSHTWSQTYTASQSVTSGIVKINTENLGLNIASAIVSLVPFYGDILSTITQMTGEFIFKANILQHANNFAQIAPNHTRLDMIVEATGIKAAIYYQDLISTPALLQPKATSWWKQVIETINKISGMIEETAFGKLYSTYEAQLGHYHASKLIGEISAGRFDIAPKDTLPDRLFGLLKIIEDDYAAVG